MSKNDSADTLPPCKGRVLLHSCCAPCSAAVIENLLQNGIDFSVYYYNPNIVPREEYELRKSENKKFAERFGVEFIDGDWDNENWLSVCGSMMDLPERGARCLECFKMRLLQSAKFAKSNGYAVFTTTLAASRWKSVEQLNEAGKFAESAVGGVKFWARNWRKGGLTERRAQLLRQYNFYNQTYCGCKQAAACTATELRSFCDTSARL